MDTLAIDIETYSDVSLPDCGVHRYAASEQFEILLFAYSLNDEPTKIIDLASGEKMPDEIMKLLTDDSVIKTAYNAAFERNCINRYFGLSLKPEGWRCTLVQASMLSLPLSLEGVGEALNLDKKKMSEGKELIRFFCMPCKPSKSNGGRTRNLPSDEPEKWELFKTYCIRDVDVEKQIRNKLSKFPIPDREQELYCMDQRINDRGIMVDPELITHAVACDLLYKETATKKAYEISGLENPNSVAQLKGWLATLFTYAGPNYVSILKHLGKDDEATAAQAEIDKMKANIMESAWDGDWFIRAYDANGEKMGSKECEEGKIFIEPQGFAIMSEIGKDQGCDMKTLAAIDERLNTKHGLVLNNPAYTKYYIQYGEISTYPGGYKENAGIFTHNNAWIICAAAYAGQGDQAFKYYSEIAPAFTEETSDIHKTEPYVYGQMIGGKDAGSDIGQTGKNFGQGKNSWLTGTAAWNMVAISQYILGVQPDFDGLKIDPSIPSAWDGLKASRQFRGDTYDIEVKNPDHVCKGVKSMTVDGKAIDGNVIPVAGDGKAHKVEVVLG